MKYLPSRESFDYARKFVINHKVVSTVILIVVLSGSYITYSKLTSDSGKTKYVVANAEKGNVISSITGSGQVLASNQIDLKPKASGDIIYVGVTNGQEVRAGEVILKIDDTNAQKNLRDAEVNLESAQISFEKLKGPDGLSTPRNKQQAEDDLAKSYDDGFSSVSNAFLDLPSIMTSLQDILYGTTIGKTQDNISALSDSIKDYDQSVTLFSDDARNKYKAARDSYDKNFSSYKSSTRFSNQDDIEKLVNDTYNTTKLVADSIKSTNNLLQFYKDTLATKNLKPQSIVDTYITNTSTLTGTVNGDLVNLLNSKNNIKSQKDAVSNSDLDIRSQELSVKQRENALLDAKNALEDYTLRAPFDGTIGKITVKKYDSASSGSAAATLITKQKLAEISLNEVDASKIKVGDKVTLTFDAIDGLSISGLVAELDSIGTVSQGVVTYNVKISFDTQDTRIKSGMSVSASIITDVKQDVLTVPNSAVKNQNGNYYVEIFNPPIDNSTGNQGTISVVAPERIQVEVGASNDTSTEITSGLKAGDQVVTRTINPSTSTTAGTAPNILQSAGVRTGGNAGGGNFRAQQR